MLEDFTYYLILLDILLEFHFFSNLVVSNLKKIPINNPIEFRFKESHEYGGVKKISFDKDVLSVSSMKMKAMIENNMKESSKLELTPREIEILLELIFEPASEELAAPVELVLARAASAGPNCSAGLQ